jgi:hypothetical protein
MITNKTQYSIWDFLGGVYEDFHLVGYIALYNIYQLSHPDLYDTESIVSVIWRAVFNSATTITTDIAVLTHC